MSLPKKLTLISVVLITSVTIGLLSPIFASAEGRWYPGSAASQVDQTTTSATSSAAVTNEKGQVKGFWIPVLVGFMLWEEIFGPGVIKKGIDCVKDFDTCVRGGLIASENFVYLQASGCDFEMPTTNSDGSASYPEDSCAGQKLAAVREGKSFAEIPNKGMLDIASGVLNTALSVPVPISGGQYLASLNPFRSTQAQATGAEELASSETLLNIWKAVRNGAYALSAVILVIMGFMIMLRRRLDPRTTVTIANSLPRIVIALILITFSFAISGLMVDLTRVITGIAVGFVSGARGNVIGLALLAISSIVGIGAGMILAVGGIPVIGPVAALVLLAIALIIVIILLVVFITLIFKIIMRYVTFLILTLFAPLFFVIGALPGAEGIILTWFKRQAAALLAIPATAIVVHLSFIIGFQNLTGDRLPLPWIVPGAINAVLQWTVLSPIVGIGLFFFATKMPDIVDEMLGVRPLPRGGIGPGALIGAPIGAMVTAGSIMKSWGYTQRGREALGRVVKGVGWGARPPPETRPATYVRPEEGGPVYEYTPPAAQRGGMRAGLARTATRAGGRLLGIETPPSRPIIKGPEQLAKEAREKRKAARETFGTEGSGKTD